MDIAYFDCYSGISGDMILGALFDLGLDEKYLINQLKKVDVSGYKLKVKKIEKKHILGTDVLIELHGKQKKRDFKEILELIDKSKLDKEIKEISKKIFSKIAFAEGKIHNINPEKIHFHEVGAVDSIIDIIGTVIVIKKMQLSNIICSPLPLGNGFVECSHGKIPVPAPATLEILKNIPAYSTKITNELVTPTGAAIISTLANQYGPMPLLKIKKIGYGAGKTDLEHPNFLRIILGETQSDFNYDVTTIIETNIDDMNPEIYGYLVEKLYDGGALDVFFTHIQMKKNRPGVKISVICKNVDVKEIANILFKESSTFGIRFYETKRLKLKIKKRKIQTKYGPISVKIGMLGNKIHTISPEYEDCRKIANKNNITLKEVYELAKKKIKQ
jgi:uncharacterized protein (TIGR00299 family) protein